MLWEEKLWNLFEEFFHDEKLFSFLSLSYLNIILEVKFLFEMFGNQ